MINPVQAQIFDLTKIEFPELAYLSVSETPIKPNSKAYTFGFEYTFVEWLQMHNVTNRYSYSTMIFKDGHRLKEKVTGYGNVFIFDIDSKPGKPSYKAKQVIKQVEGLEALVVSTRSHTEENHRLRLIVLADKCLRGDVSAELYEQIMLTMIEFLDLDADLLDRSCFSTDRQYAPNPVSQKQYYIKGDLIPMDFIVEIALKKLAKKAAVKKAAVIIPTSSSKKGIKKKRAYIKDHLTFDLMVEVLEERGFTVTRDGKVIIPGNPTDALHISKDTGLLRDFANDMSYDPVSVLHDYYKVPIKDATNYIYEKLGGR